MAKRNGPPPVKEFPAQPYNQTDTFSGESSRISGKAPSGMAHGREESGLKLFDFRSPNDSLPVQPETDPRPMADRISLIDEEGEALGWATEADVRGWLKAGQVELLGTRKRVRTVRVLSHARRPAGLAEGPPARRRWHGRSASHNRETEHNPKGVWTFTEIQEWPNAERGGRGRKAA
jgi:hypothetical protein